MSSHESIVGGVASTAQELIMSRHVASEQIAEQRDRLLSAWSGLQESVDTRTLQLTDSLQVQQVPVTPRK